MNKATLFRLTASALLAVMMLTALPSCFADGGETREASTIDGRDVDDGIPDGLNYNGKTVTFLSNTYEMGTVVRDTINNDILNDALYNRKFKVNERLGVKLNFVADDEAYDKASTSILTGLDEYQILSDSSGEMLKLAASNGLIDYNGDLLTYVNLDHQWYNPYFREKVSIYGKLYGITGSLSLSSIMKCSVTAFNPIVLEEQGITENLYETVRRGKWTIAKELDLIKKCYSDTTGNGVTQDDAFGLCFDNSSALDYFWSAFDLSLMKRTDDGGLELTDNTEKFVSAIELVYSMMYENPNVNCFDQDECDEGGAGEYGPTLLAENRTLFIMTTLNACGSEIMRGMKAEYGVLPMPKWDEYQDDYYTCLRDGFVLIGVPKTNRNTEMTSAVIEALSSEAYATVIPAYYERILKYRYMNDLDSMKMLDLITANINMDYALIHGFALSQFSTEAFRTLLRAEKCNFASFWRIGKRKYTRELQNMLSQYESFDD